MILSPEKLEEGLMRARKRGAKAREGNIPRRSNPYAKDGAMFDAWDEGWYERHLEIIRSEHLNGSV
jgi:hypothetical protein